MKYTTIQRRHSEKWLSKVINVTAYTLANCFSGEDVPVEYLRTAIERGDNLKIAEDKKSGRLHVHSNKWYEFKMSETEESANPMDDVNYVGHPIHY